MSKLDDLIKEKCPNGVKFYTISEVANVTAGNSAPQKFECFEEGGYPFVRTGDVGKIHRSINLCKTEDGLSEIGIKGMRLFPKGSILFPKSGASTLLNHRARLGVNAYVVSHLAVIIPDESKIDSKFLYYLTTTMDARRLVEDESYP